MSLRLITPPEELAVSLDAAREAARVDGTDLDAEVERVLRGHIEEAEHYCGRAFITQTWALTLAAFPDEIRLAKSPLVSVAHIKYYDADNTLRTLDPALYMVDPASEPGVIQRAPAAFWPCTYKRSNAVEVQFVCGYGADNTAVPDGIKGYILAKVQEDFAPPGTPKSEYISCLLDRFKVYG